jgi:hypothetical protein
MCEMIRHLLLGRLDQDDHLASNHAQEGIWKNTAIIRMIFKLGAM